MLRYNSQLKNLNLNKFKQVRFAGGGPHYSEPTGHLFAEKVRLSCCMFRSIKLTRYIYSHYHQVRRGNGIHGNLSITLDFMVVY